MQKGRLARPCCVLLPRNVEKFFFFFELVASLDQLEYRENVCKPSNSDEAMRETKMVSRYVKLFECLQKSTAEAFFSVAAFC